MKVAFKRMCPYHPQLMQWIEEQLQTDPDAWIVKAELLDAYNDYVRECRTGTTVSPHLLTKALRFAFPDIQLTQRTINGRSGVWVWRGVSLKDVEVQSDNSAAKACRILEKSLTHGRQHVYSE